MSLSLQPLTGVYEEVVLSPEVLGRICLLEPCGDPLCDCRVRPPALFLYSDVERDAWVAGRVLPEESMDELIATVCEDAQVVHHMLINSVLFGTPWEFFVNEDTFNSLVDSQQDAHVKIPSWYWERPIEELRRLRASIYATDPRPVTALLCSAYFYAHEPGGSRGYRG